MKLLFIFLVFVFFALVQEIGARPHPEDSSSSWWIWPTTSSSNYDADTLTTSLDLSDISLERADLLSQGTKLANQVLDLVEIVPGLESVSKYGKVGVKMAENLGKNAMGAVKSGVNAMLTIIEQAIEGLKNLSSVGENMLSSLHLTREHLVSVNSVVNYL